MSYADILNGTTRTRTPVERVMTADERTDVRRLASVRERLDAEDSREFRELRAAMRATHGVCG